jgi:KUP system potassium uptake protein
VPGTAVFMSAPGEGGPHALLHNIKHNKVLHERVIVLTIRIEEDSRVPSAERFTLRDLDLNIQHLTARFGFMEFPDVPRLLTKAQALGLEYKPMETSFFLSRLRILPTTAPNMALWREKLFAFMMKNASLATDFFGLPTNQVMEFDLRVEI